MNSSVDRRYVYALALLVVVLLTCPPARGDEDGRAIMVGVWGQYHARTRRVVATLEVFDQSGKSTKRAFVEYRLADVHGVQALLAFTAPPSLHGLQILSLAPRGNQPQQWILPASAQRARPAATPALTDRFLGSDFTFEDLAEPVVDDFSYHVLATAPPVNGYAVWQIESVPRDAGRSQYARVRYTVARDIHCILAAEMLDSEGRRVRTVKASRFARRAGIWGPQRVEARTVADGTHSILTVSDATFDVRLPEHLFTPEALEAGIALHGLP